MKDRLGVKESRPLADFLPTLTIKAENLPPSEDIRKLERRVQKEDKQLAKKSGKLNNRSHAVGAWPRWECAEYYRSFSFALSVSVILFRLKYQSSTSHSIQAKIMKKRGKATK